MFINNKKHNFITMVFFAKNKKSALKRLKILQNEDRYYNRYKTVKLAKHQIKHINKWKTWIFK